MQGPIIIGDYVMSESEQIFHLGEAVRDHARAELTLEQLSKYAAYRRHVCESLAKALSAESPEKIALDLRAILEVRRAERFDWSKLTPESLLNLAAALKAGVEAVETTAASERRLKAQYP